MLKTLSELDGAVVHASDGDVGKVVEFLFDDQSWTIRYLVVRTGGWLSERKVLISPIAVGAVDWEDKMIHVGLTREQVKHSPDIDTDKPVSRQWESGYSDYFGWSYYWGGIGFSGAAGSGSGLWGGGYFPGALAAIPISGIARSPSEESAAAEPEHTDTRLRSAEEVTGYGIGACDGELGHVDGFILDDETWTIRYLVVDTRNWWPGKKILLPPQWIKAVSWTERNVITDFTGETVRNAPEWDPKAHVTREFEHRLHAYYGRTGYWHSEREGKLDC